MSIKEQIIWVLDDSMFFCKLIENHLQQEGFNNISLFNESDSFFNDQEFNPHVVILDHFINNEIGLDVLEKIKNLNKNCKVIYMSSQETVHVAIKSLKMGAFAYLEKDLDGIKKIKGIIEQDYSNDNTIHLD